MRSLVPRDTTLANIFLVYHKKKLAGNCPLEYTPFYYQRQVDDIFALLNSSEHKLPCQYIFYYKKQKKTRCFLRDPNIIREQCKFTTSLYHKSTYYTYFDSFLPSTNKIAVIHKLLYKCFQICSDWTKIHLELVKLMAVFKTNGFLENCITVLKHFLITNIKYKKNW